MNSFRLNIEIDNTEYVRYIADSEDIKDYDREESWEDQLNTDNSSVDKIINELKETNKEIDNIINDIDKTNDQGEDEKLTSTKMMQKTSYQQRKRHINISLNVVTRLREDLLPDYQSIKRHSNFEEYFVSDRENPSYSWNVQI